MASGGPASRWWLHHSLQSLDASLKERGARLVLRKGDSAEILAELIKRTKASAVYWNRRYEPAVIARDTALKTALQSEGVEVKSFNSGLLFEPHAVANKQGKPFQVFPPSGAIVFRCP